MTTRIVFAVALAIRLCASTTWAGETTRALDFIRFADDGTDIVIDLPGLDGVLSSGADPNWINREQLLEESTLGHFVFKCSYYSRSITTDADCIRAINNLISAGAKLQPVDREILFPPVEKGKPELVAILLELGADATRWPNKTLGTLYSPVEYAVKEGHQTVVDLLVEHGATRPAQKDAIQWRFIEAAKFGSYKLLGELVKKGVNINEKGREDESALINAARDKDGCQSYAKIHILLNAGAGPNISGQGLPRGITTTPLHQAVRSSGVWFNPKKETADSLCGKMALKELMKRGAHVSSKDSSGQTPLHIAAERNNLLAAQLLVKAGAKVKLRDNTGKPPLDLAESGEMIKLLKSHGASKR